jgi:hypothetical protein
MMMMMLAAASEIMLGCHGIYWLYARIYILCGLIYAGEG